MSLAELETLETLKRCTKASALIYAGQYEEARGVLGHLWRGIGEGPSIDNQPPEVGAEIPPTVWLSVRLSLRSAGERRL